MYAQIARRLDPCSDRCLAALLLAAVAGCTDARRRRWRAPDPADPHAAFPAGRLPPGRRSLRQRAPRRSDGLAGTERARRAAGEAMRPPMRPTAFRHAAAFAAALLLSAAAPASRRMAGSPRVDAITAPALGDSAVDTAHARTGRSGPRAGQGAAAPAALAPTAPCRSRSQQPRAAGRLQRARPLRGRAGAGEPAAQSDLLASNASRAAARSRSKAASSAACCSSRRLPARAEIAADRFRQAQLQAAVRNAAHRERSAARVLSRGRGARAAVTISTQARETGETAARARQAARRDRRDEQARPGAQPGASMPSWSAQLATARLRAASERERLVRALGLWGDDLAFSLPAQLPAAAGARARARRRRSRSGAPPASICRWRGSRSTCWPSPTASPTRRASSTCSRSRASPRSSARTARRRASAASRSSSRSRCSISAT